MARHTYGRGKGHHYSTHSARGGGRGGRHVSTTGRPQHHAGNSDLRVPYLEDLISSTETEAEGLTLRFHSSSPDLSPIPPEFPSAASYLKSMQAHCEAEYYSAILQGRREAGWATDASWRIFTTGTSGDGRPFLRVHGCDFNTDPWGRHLVEVEGCKEAKLVTFCSSLVDASKLEDCVGQLVVQGMRSLESQGKVRSLGYIGPFLLEYGSAQGLIAVPPERNSPAWQLLQMVSAPCTRRNHDLSTLSSLDSSTKLDSESVPINTAQEAAVRGLRPGLEVIHGPPGSGD
jgi:hypothetical protein